MATIANTILAQLGGRKFIVMTGARELTDTGRGLQFALPAGSAKAGINLIRITLDPSDTYTVEFFARRGAKVRPVSSHSGVYCDQLCDIFTGQTGLYTSL